MEKLTQKDLITWYKNYHQICNGLHMSDNDYNELEKVNNKVSIAWLRMKQAINRHNMTK